MTWSCMMQIDKNMISPTWSSQVPQHTLSPLLQFSAWFLEGNDCSGLSKIAKKNKSTVQNPTLERIIYVPGQTSRFLGEMVIPPLMGNPYIGFFLTPLLGWWVYPLPFGNNGCLDPSTYKIIHLVTKKPPLPVNSNSTIEIPSHQSNSNISKHQIKF